jgi:hypothetical protein
MRGRGRSNSRQSSASERRSCSSIGANVREMLREQRPGSLEKDLLIVGIELPHREAAPAREPTERIREPGGQAGEVVKCQQITVVGGNHQLAFLPRQRPHGATLGSTNALSILHRTVLADPCSPDIANNG